MLKKAWRSMRCRMRHAHACPHVPAYHQTPRERAAARAAASAASAARTRQLINS